MYCTYIILTYPFIVIRYKHDPMGSVYLGSARLVILSFFYYLPLFPLLLPNTSDPQSQFFDTRVPLTVRHTVSV